jgi:predicted nucleic acid-binding protein
VKAIADTGFVVAFLNRRDEFHGWAVKLADEIETPMLACESVISEASYNLDNSEGGEISVR